MQARVITWTGHRPDISFKIPRPHAQPSTRPPQCCRPNVSWSGVSAASTPGQPWRRIGGSSPEAAYTERNRLLATSADLLVAVWTGRGGGGPAETLAFARAAGVPIREVRLPASPLGEHATGRGL